MFTAVKEHERKIAQLVGVASRQALFGWRRMGKDYSAQLSRGWQIRLPSIEAELNATLRKAALEGSISSAFALAEQGVWVTPNAFVDVDAFVGYSAAGYPLQQALSRPVPYTKQLIGSGVPVQEALRRGGMLLQGIVSTQVTDVARQAAQVDIATRVGTGYTRMVGPGACSRCTILAGKFFRWNQGFLRHPRCNCVHVATTAKSTAAARAEGLIDDPYEAFHALSEAEQNRIYGASNAAAIRDGSDIYQVTNARRRSTGITTAEGTSRRGYASNLKGKRLTPEGIYSQNLSREETLKLLREHKYILPGGQVPGGSIRGQTEGFGALGAGGRRVGARTAVENARRTGVRVPGTRATMTEAERRLSDARGRYEAVLGGRNPYGKTPLTPQLAANAEADYKRWLATGGQIFN